MTLHLMYSVPKCGSIRLKMASAVEGCLYKRLNVVPGRPSRYSNDRREDADIWSEAYLVVTSTLLRYLSIIAEALRRRSVDNWVESRQTLIKFPHCYPALGPISEPTKVGLPTVRVPF